MLRTIIYNEFNFKDYTKLAFIIKKILAFKKSFLNSRIHIIISPRCSLCLVAMYKYSCTICKQKHSSKSAEKSPQHQLWKSNFYFILTLHNMEIPHNPPFKFYIYNIYKNAKLHEDSRKRTFQDCSANTISQNEFVLGLLIFVNLKQKFFLRGPSPFKHFALILKIYKTLHKITNMQGISI